MKKALCLYVLLFLLLGISKGQEILVFKGTVKCYIADDPRSTRGANNVIVVPGFVPVKAGMTGAQGYYEINTSIPVQKLEGKYVLMYYISSCKTCEVKKNVFISEDQLRASGNKNLTYLTVETMQMNAGCKNTELPPLQSDSIYNTFVKQPGQDLDKVAALNVVTATPGFLNLLTTLAAAPGLVSGISSDADPNNILPGNIKGYGKFLLASPMFLSSNTGFNFSPSRDLSEAVFWNPSALANGYHAGGAYLFTNLKNNYKLSGYARINDRLIIGAGGIYTQQDESRLTIYKGLVGPASHLRNLKEYAAYITPAFAINKDLSMAVAGKSIWQNFNRPNKVVVVQSPLSNTFIDSTANQQHFDADLSISYNASRSFKIGVNIMNLAGTELFSDAVPVQKKDVPIQKLRSLGIGVCYKWKQFNFGTDILLTQDDLYDVTLGINYIPFNNALLSGGFAFKQKSFSLTYKMKYFKLSYVNDNGFMVNEKRKGKSSLFNGYLSSGLVFDF